MTRFIYFISMLLISGSLSAQNLAINRIAPVHLNSPDSVKVRTNYADRSDFHFKSALLPVSLVAAGAIIESLPSQTYFSKERDQMRVQNRINGFRTKADNYLQFVPVAALFSFKLAGMKSRSDLLNQAIISAKSEFLMLAIVSSMKYVIHDWRPDETSDNTMPSGHTAQAFVSATLLDMEYRDTSPWISVGGYLCATATGIFRVTNNRHWVSDVLIGAGIGIASVKVVYLTHRYRWSKMSSAVIVPTLYQNGGGVAFAMKF
ncbi:MAG: phosphatase PAP2 family protein [Bacteroidetes bacterium]|nr:phosphatase PAP2 family protein [Bacteroidota bacterium]MCL6103528.1 phosphatase PAP2 family protein [Bacteroidota bacterium]